MGILSNVLDLFVSYPIKEDNKVDYIVLDLETSGLNIKTTEIIEISAIKVKDSTIIDKYTSLVFPKKPIDPAATQINHITPEMLKGQRTIQTVFPEFKRFIGDNLLAGYNISTFDMPILRRVAASLNIPLQNDCIDILHLANIKMSFLPNRKLTTVAAYFGIDTTGSHRALQDCIITKECYERLLTFQPPAAPSKKQEKKYKVENTNQTSALQQLHALLLGIISDNQLTESEVNTLNLWLNNNRELQGQFPYDRVSAIVSKSLQDGILEQSELDDMLQVFREYTTPIFEEVVDVLVQNKNFCLTGNFEHGTKSEIEQLITQHGGFIKSSVSSKTDYLVVGSKGSPDWTCGNYGTKIKKAKEVQAAGGKVQLVSENNLLETFQKNQ